MIIIKFNDLGLSAATLRLSASENDRKIVNVIFSLALKYKKYLTLIIVPLGILFSTKLTQLIGFDQPQIIIVAFLFGIITTYYEQLLAMLQSVHFFNQAVMANAIQASVKLLMALSITFLGVHSTAIIFSLYALAPLTPVLLSKFLLPQWVRLNVQKESFELSNKLKRLSLHFSVALMSAGIIENIDIFFIQRSLNIYETGLYSGVSRIAMMITLIAYSMGNVLYPRVAKYKSSDHLGRYLKKASGVALLALLGFLAFLPISRWVIFFTIGPDYLSGQVIMNLLALSSFLVIASIPFVALFYTLKATWYFSVSAVLQLIIVLVGNFYYVPLYGLEAAAWTRLVTRLFLFTFTVITGLVLYQREYGGRTQKNLA
jgi:O-antigen/teichoic acid export membrane protein